jgi:hypothetical protein
MTAPSPVSTPPTSKPRLRATNLFKEKTAVVGFNVSGNKDTVLKEKEGTREALE